MSTFHSFTGIVIGPREQVRAVHERVLAAEREQPSSTLEVAEQQAGDMLAMIYQASRLRTVPAVDVVLTSQEASTAPRGVTILADALAESAGWVGLLTDGKVIAKAIYDTQDPDTADAPRLPPQRVFDTLRREMGFTEPGPVFRT